MHKDISPKEKKKKNVTQKSLREFLISITNYQNPKMK
jgi:hypothetical protein